MKRNDRVEVTGGLFTHRYGQQGKVTDIVGTSVYVLMEDGNLISYVRDSLTVLPKPESLEEKRARLLEELEQVDGEIKERDRPKAADLDVGNMVYTQRYTDRDNGTILYVKVGPNSWRLVTAGGTDKVYPNATLVYFDGEVQMYFNEPKYRAVVIKP